VGAGTGYIFFYAGRVQGVGFRFAAKMLARGSKVTGVVRNLPDGRVEMLAEGERNGIGRVSESVQDSEVGHFIRQEENLLDRSQKRILKVLRLFDSTKNR